MVPLTFTWLPPTIAGRKVACRAAASAAGRNSGWPLTAFAEVTLPFSSTVTWTTTGPDALAALATGGYGGFGKLVARLSSAPADMTPEFEEFAGDNGEGVSIGVAMGTAPDVEADELPVAGLDDRIEHPVPISKKRTAADLSMFTSLSLKY
jgi:hypothetical protein